jgi:hypothetical protein
MNEQIASSTSALLMLRRFARRSVFEEVAAGDLR